MNNHNFSMASCSPVAEILAQQEGALFGDLGGNHAAGEYVRSRIADRLCALLEGFDSVSFARQDARQWMDHFLDIYYPNVPADLRNQAGSTDAMGLLILHLVAKAICPDLIIESGVFIGSSLHMFSRYFEDVPVYAFDISLKNLAFNPPKAVLVESDWSEHPEFPVGDNGFVFFDDHISCAKRILECKARGIRWVVFDDAPSVGNMPRYRYPALPSVDMILDKEIPVDSVFEWHHKATDMFLRYVFDSEQAAMCSDARAFIRRAACLDAFSDITGRSGGDKWLVEIDL